MRNKFKAFIGIAIISLSLFVTPIGVFLSTVDVEGVHMVAVSIEPTIAFAGECASLENFSIIACISTALEGIFEIVWWVVSFLGRFLDFFIDYSISSQTYAQGSDFVHRGWALVRDIANIFFIFVLLYIAIGTILNLKQVDTKKMLTKVIIVALLINFSLFFTKIVIDASNILARSFVGSVYIHSPVKAPDGSMSDMDSNSFSAAIMSQLKVQKFLNTDPGSPYHFYAQDQGTLADVLRGATAFMGIVVLVILASTFIKVAFLFLARVITLWLSMITAPIAFISIVLPFNIPKLGHQEWTKKLVEGAFMAPIFLFFMYLLVLFLQLDVVSSALANSGGAQQIPSFGKIMMGIIVPFAIIIMLVLAAAKVAEQMSGEIGAVVAKAGGAALGAVAVVATGGAAMGMRMGAGAIGSKMASSTASGRLGRMTRSMGSKLETGSMDWRNTKGGQAIMKNMGMDNYGVGSWGAKAGEGGAKGVKERYEKTRMEDAKRYTDNRTAPQRKELEEVEDRMTEFNDIFGDTIKDLEEKVVAARTALKDHAAKEPEKPTVPRNAKNKAVWAAYDADKATHDADKATLTTNMDKAQTNLSDVTDKPQPGFKKSYSDMKTDARTAKQNVAKASTSARTEYAQGVKDEWFTGQSQKTQDSLGKKIRFNRQANKTS